MTLEGMVDSADSLQMNCSQGKDKEGTCLCSLSSHKKSEGLGFRMGLQEVIIQGLSQNQASVAVLGLLGDVVRERSWHWDSSSDKQPLTSRPSDAATAMKGQDTG